MPVVPLLAGLVAVLAVALVWLVAAERRARASAPDDAAVAQLRARLDALRERYAEIGADVSALVIDAGATITEGTALDAAPIASRPAAPREDQAPGAVDARNVSTTAPARIRLASSPPTPNVPASAPAASA